MLKKKIAVLLLALIGIGALLAYNFFISGEDRAEIFLKPVSLKVNQIANEFDQDFIDLLMQNRPEEPIKFARLDINSFHPYFVFEDDGTLVYWSDFSFLPEFELIRTQQNPNFYEDRQGIYFTKVRRFTRNEQGFWLVHAYPLYFKRVIQNEFLQTGFNNTIFGNDFLSLSSYPLDDYLDLNNDKNEYLFSIKFEQGYQSSDFSSNYNLLVFFFSLLFLILILGYSFIRVLWVKGKGLTAITYTSAILVIIRFFMLFFGFPQDYFDFELFDSSKYASSWLNPSLGDLFLNVIVVAIIFSMLLAFLRQKSFMHIFNQWKRGFYKWFFFILVYAIALILLVGFYGLYINIMSNSQWELNILSLPSLDYFKVISLIIIFLGAGGYILFSILGLSLILENEKTDNVYALKVLVIFSSPIIILLAFLNYVHLFAFIAHVIFLVSIITFDLHKNIFKIGLNTFLTFFFACLITAIIAGIAAHDVFLKKQLQAKSRFGTQQLVENDVMAEFFLSDIMERIKEDLFIKNSLTDPFQAKEPIERKIRRIHMTNYFDQYALRVKVFNASGDNVLVRNDEETLEFLRNNYVKSDYVTSVKDLYFIKGNEEGTSNQYFAFIPLYRDNLFIGTVYLELRQLRILPGAVFPKLLMDMNYMPTLNDKNYDYAIFQESELQYTVGVFNYRAATFEDLLTNASLYTTGIYKRGYHHYGLANGEKVIVVSSPIYPLYYILADISLFFLAFILLTLFSLLGYALFRGLRSFDFNYATKLQMYLNFAFFFPILIISAIILGLLTSSYQEELHRQYFQKASLVRDNLAGTLEKIEAGVADRDDFYESVNSLSSTTNLEINAYSPQGYLLTSSQPNIFDKRILTKYINPKAIVELVEGQNNLVLLSEKVGSLGYKAVYASIRSTDGQNIQAIIAIPFFESENELDLLIADVLSNILNIFVLVFILFLFVSYFVSKNLTFPFKLLTQKLKATDLENNEPMYWPVKDEIGLLVNEYNNMLFKLEASKNILASTEKESAWREMAKQVAHEIKNPLTPMKLTLQHMLRLQAEGKIDDPQMLKKPVETLIHQVDTLSDIATSFSTFAKMPLPKNEVMDFRKVVQDTLELFKTREKGTIGFEDLTGSEEIKIIGDDQLFGRIISNLIINGIQSVEEPIKPEIEVVLKEDNGKVILAIKDNGKGIAEELKDKIFIPNFSTKSEGSGLGLAIAKRGVETAGGRIWFETQVGQGSTFFMEFALVK
jgi:two-component system nitrogen regulation sensor histidine kinase NtrY